MDNGETINKKKYSNEQLFEQITLTWHNINVSLPEEKKQNNSCFSKLPCCKPLPNERMKSRIINDG